MPDLGAILKDAFLSIFRPLLKPFIAILKGIVQTGVEIILYTPVPKRCVKGVDQSYPDCPTTVALVQQPANSPWPSVYKTAWTEVLPTAVTILFVLYLVIRVLEAVPGISRKKTRQAQTSIFGALVTLPFSWSFGAGVLAFFSGLTKALAPTPDEFLPIVTSQLGALITAAATPGGNFLALGISGLDGALLIGAVLAYLFRILFLLFVMQYIHLLAVIYLLDVPVLNGITTKIFEVFIALSFVPLLVAGMFDFATTLFSAGGDLPFLPDLDGFAKAIISMVLPVASLGLYYLSLKGAMLSGMSKTLGKVESATSGTAVGELGEASSDEYGGLVEEKTAQVENHAQRGSQFIGNKSKRLALSGASAATFMGKNPKQAARMLKEGGPQNPRETTPSRNLIGSAKQTAKRKLSAYKSVPESASKAMARGGLEGRGGDDSARRNVGTMGKKRPDTDTPAYQFGDWDNRFERKLVKDENTGKSIARTMGSVRESGRSIEEIAEESEMPSGGVNVEERDAPKPVDPESVEQGEEPFDRMIDESDLSIEGAQILMENIQDEYGEDVMKEKMDEMSYVQLARESGREQAEVSLDPSQVEDIISPPDWRM